MAKNDRHVVPVDDLIEHDLSVNCWCNPKIEVIGADLLVIHNAADMREVLEDLDNGRIEDLLNEEIG